MRVKYFADTDTALLEFSTNPPVETREVNENIYIDLDNKGRVVSLTIEHAGQSWENSGGGKTDFFSLAPTEGPDSSLCSE